MTTKSPGRRRARPAPGATAFSRRALSSASSAPSGTSTSARPTSRPVYSPRVALGRTWTVAWKVRSPSSGTLSRSRSGSSIGSTPVSATAAEYQPPSDPLSISCTTASRPTRCTITSAGRLARAEAGDAHLASQLADGAIHAALDLVLGDRHVEADLVLLERCDFCGQRHVHSRGTAVRVYAGERIRTSKGCPTRT